MYSARRGGFRRPDLDAQTQRHDGTTTLSAALNVATGEVLQECLARHRHNRFYVPASCVIMKINCGSSW